MNPPYMKGMSHTPNNKTPITYYKGQQTKTSASSTNLNSLSNTKRYSTTQKLNGISKITTTNGSKTPKQSNLMQTQRLTKQSGYNHSSKTNLMASSNSRLNNPRLQIEDPHKLSDTDLRLQNGLKTGTSQTKKAGHYLARPTVASMNKSQVMSTKNSYNSNAKNNAASLKASFNNTSRNPIKNGLADGSQRGTHSFMNTLRQPELKQELKKISR